MFRCLLLLISVKNAPTNRGKLFFFFIMKKNGKNNDKIQSQLPGFEFPTTTKHEQNNKKKHNKTKGKGKTIVCTNLLKTLQILFLLATSVTKNKNNKNKTIILKQLLLNLKAFYVFSIFVFCFLFSFVTLFLQFESIIAVTRKKQQTDKKQKKKKKKRVKKVFRIRNKSLKPFSIKKC